MEQNEKTQQQKCCQNLDKSINKNKKKETDASIDEKDV